MHNLTQALPLLGDTTSNQVLLFSPVLANATPANSPTYPNYTLPPANLSLPSGDTSLLTGLSVFVAPTASLAKGSLPLTGCAMRDSKTDGSIAMDAKPSADNGLWLKDDSDGWRFQWLISGLSSQTNYTAYVIQDGTKLSGPINFVTKSGMCYNSCVLISKLITNLASFSCPIVHSLPYCPSTSYAVPITAPKFPAIAHTSNTLPGEVTEPLLQTLTNFSISLTTFPCGRDEYSPLVSCSDCDF